MSGTEEDLSQEVEEVTPTPGPEPEVEWGADVLHYMESRKEDLEIEESPEEPEEAEGEEVQEAAPEDPEAAPEPEDNASRTARRALAREKKLRSEREAFAAEQGKWRNETEETRTKVEAFEKSQANAVMDPVSHLSHIGLSDDDLMNVAREIYYKFMPEQATPAVQAEMASIQYNRRLKKLEKDNEPSPPPTGPSPEYQTYEQNYRSELTAFAAAVDPEEFPLTAPYVKTNFHGLVQEMFNAALLNPNKHTGRDLTPQECMAAVEEALRARQPEQTPAPTQIKEESPRQTKRAPIRNKTAAVKPNEKHDDDLSYEEYVAKCRERSMAVLSERGMVK